MHFSFYDSLFFPPTKVNERKSWLGFPVPNWRDGFVPAALTTAHIPPIVNTEAWVLYTGCKEHAPKTPSDPLDANCHLIICTTEVVFGRPTGKRTSGMLLRSTVNVFAAEWWGVAWDVLLNAEVARHVWAREIRTITSAAFVVRVLIRCSFSYWTTPYCIKLHLTVYKTKMRTVFRWFALASNCLFNARYLIDVLCIACF